ncbi:MAG: hypothetical protein U5K71_16425 [Gracilimonas sp.]|nr:hypothetical protein [Gracilimonas sp.]
MRDLSVLKKSQGITVSNADSFQSEITAYKKPDSFTIDLITDQEQFEQLEEEWDELLDKSEGTIYSSFNWVYGWWKHFGKNKHRSLADHSHSYKLANWFVLHLYT